MKGKHSFSSQNQRGFFVSQSVVNRLKQLSCSKYNVSAVIEQFLNLHGVNNSHPICFNKFYK